MESEIPGDLANAAWPELHISHRKRSSNFSGIETKATDTTDTTIWKPHIQPANTTDRVNTTCCLR